MKGILRYIRPYYGYLALTLAIKFVASVMDLLIPSILAQMIDRVVPLGEARPIFLWGGAMLLCALISVLSNVTANRMAARSAGKITLRIRHDLFCRISHFSARQLDRVSIPSSVSRLTSDTYNINQMLARMQRIGVRGPILLVGGVAITLTMDVGLTCVLLATLPLIAFVVYFVTKKSVPVYTRQQSVLDDMVRVTQENIAGVRVVRALSKTDYETGRFEAVNKTLADTEQRAGNLMAITNPASTLILNLGLTLVVLVGAFRIQAGQTQPGVIIAFLSYFTIILNAMLGITRIFILCSKGAASARRVSELLELPDDQPVLPAAPARESEAVAFSHVSFSYQGVRDNLTDLSFSIDRGQTLGIIGATGSGKSTVLQLLLRCYDADRGEVRVFGQDVRTIPPEILRTQIGVVFQNDFLLAGTAADNIRYFRDLPDEALSRAASLAQADAFLRESPEGLQRPVLARGNNLSGGQKQRLLIARALASQPALLLLDDASSALDYRTDAALRRALRTACRDTTTVIVAQRVSAIRHADRILVLDEGKSIGFGTHETLLRDCPVYRSLCEIQMGDGGEGVKGHA